MKYGIFELGYTTIAVFDNKKEADDLCNKVNTRIVKRKVKGNLIITTKYINRFFVKEVYNNG